MPSNTEIQSKLSADFSRKIEFNVPYKGIKGEYAAEIFCKQGLGILVDRREELLKKYHLNIQDIFVRGLENRGILQIIIKSQEALENFKQAFFTVDNHCLPAQAGANAQGIPSVNENYLHLLAGVSTQVTPTVNQEDSPTQADINTQATLQDKKLLFIYKMGYQGKPEYDTPESLLSFCNGSEKTQSKISPQGRGF